MADPAAANMVQERLFADEQTSVYAVLDGASVPQLLRKLSECRAENWCLFPGDLEPDMAEVAPYLVRLERGSDVCQWLLRNGWGEHWGVFLTSQADGVTLRGQLAMLVKVYGPDGKRLIFRYYDPRVLRVYLPTCTDGELGEVFGRVDAFWMEAGDPASMLCFRRKDVGLETQEIRVVKA